MIAVIDYGIGNVRSVMNALEYIGVGVELTSDFEVLSKADGLILPGVGAFGEGMRRLHATNLHDPLIKLVQSGKPLLGICLGYQMLMRSSTELGKHHGLAFMAHDVVKLPVDARLPHIGWSPVFSAKNAPIPSRLLQNLDGELFYFVHSYGVLKPSSPIVGGIASYGGCEMAALIESENVFGTQFHPEKSGEAGLAMLRNFHKICR